MIISSAHHLYIRAICRFLLFKSALSYRAFLLHSCHRCCDDRGVRQRGWLIYAVLGPICEMMTEACMKSTTCRARRGSMKLSREWWSMRPSHVLRRLWYKKEKNSRILRVHFSAWISFCKSLESAYISICFRLLPLRWCSPIHTPLKHYQEDYLNLYLLVILAIESGTLPSAEDDYRICQKSTGRHSLAEHGSLVSQAAHFDFSRRARNY